MAKMRIIEITRSLQERYPEIRNKDILKLLNENGFEVKSVQSNIEDAAIAFLLKAFSTPDIYNEIIKEREAGKSSGKKSSRTKSGSGKSSKGKKSASQAENADAAAEDEKSTEKPAAKEKKASSEKKENASSAKAKADDSEKKDAEKKSSSEKKEESASKADKNPAASGTEKENKSEKPDNSDKSDNKSSDVVSEKKESKVSSSSAGKTAPASDAAKETASSDASSGAESNKEKSAKSPAEAPAPEKKKEESKPVNGRVIGNIFDQLKKMEEEKKAAKARRQEAARQSRERRAQGGRGTRPAGTRSFDGRPGRGDRNGVRSFDGRNQNGNRGGRSFDGRPGNTGTGRPGGFGGRGAGAFAPDFGSQKPDAKKRGVGKKDYSKDKRKHNKQKFNRRQEAEFEFDPLSPDGIRHHRKKDPNRKGAFIKPEAPKPAEKEPEDTIKNIKIGDSISIKDFAEKLGIAPAKLIKDQFLKGNVYTLNQEIPYETAEELGLEYNAIIEKEEKVDVIAEMLKEDEEDESLMVRRPPVVCVMGHVDHGKTSLLDKIRSTNVTSHEEGGITQHIGAYVTEIKGRKITFLDTPGHEAFTAMRMRGAEATDIAVLVVAADDGVMPQTIEAINHAKAAGVDIIVAVNKIDKPSADVERVKQELLEYGLTPEEWGGNTIFCPVSAHTGEGIDNLLEMILLTADMKDLKANPNRNARGVVIEAKLDKGRGPVASVLVQKGTLHVGDTVAVGAAYGNIRAMTNEHGRRVKEAGPSMPVEVIGLHDVPDAGEIFVATDTEKEAKNIAAAYIERSREQLLKGTKGKLTLDGLFDQIKAGEVKQLDIIVKADVQGSAEAVKQSLEKISNDEVAVNIIHAGVGAINESDVELAIASNAIIIGFNVRTDNNAKAIAEREKVDVRLYRVIFDAIEDIQDAMKGMLDPVYEEKVIAHLEIRQIFKSSAAGIIGGAYVLDGTMESDAKVRVLRDGDQVFDGELVSLKRFQDDVKEVREGYECGIVVKDFKDLQVGDQIEAYKMVEVPR